MTDEYVLEEVVKGEEIIFKIGDYDFTFEYFRVETQLKGGVLKKFTLLIDEEDSDVYLLLREQLPHNEGIIIADRDLEQAHSIDFKLLFSLEKLRGMEFIHSDQIETPVDFFSLQNISGYYPFKQLQNYRLSSEVLR